MPKLYIAYLGGKLGNGRMGEDHEVVLVVAEDERSARQQAMEKWSGATKQGVHVDAVREVTSVDGYEIAVTGAENDLREEKENTLF